MTKKAVKGSIIADHLVDNVVEDYELLYFDLPDEDVLAAKDDGEKNDWSTMFFYRAINVSGNGVRVVIIFPEKKLYPVSVRLQFKCTNKTIEYEACIIELEVYLEPGVGKLDVYRDSLLIIYQVKERWKTKDKKLRSYQDYLLKLSNEF
jgi:hypothetical protein